MASLTKELIERLGGSAGAGAAGIAALLLAPRVAGPLGRGLRELAKGAIKGYLVVSHRARTAVDEATGEWREIYEEARSETAAVSRNGQIAPPREVEPQAGAQRPRAEREAAASTETEVVNLNRAEEEALIRLPGIGERTAEKILQYRQENGRIRSLQDLVDADILFESTAEHLRDRVEF